MVQKLYIWNGDGEREEMGRNPWLQTAVLANVATGFSSQKKRFQVKCSSHEVTGKVNKNQKC